MRESPKMLSQHLMNGIELMDDIELPGSFELLDEVELLNRVELLNEEEFVKFSELFETMKKRKILESYARRLAVGIWNHGETMKVEALVKQEEKLYDLIDSRGLFNITINDKIPMAFGVHYFKGRNGFKQIELQCFPHIFIGKKCQNQLEELSRQCQSKQVRDHFPEGWTNEMCFKFIKDAFIIAMPEHPLGLDD